MTDQKNTILAIVLSALVLIAWQIYFGLPQMEKQKQIQQQQAQERSQQQPPSLPQQSGTALGTPGWAAGWPLACSCCWMRARRSCSSLSLGLA